MKSDEQLLGAYATGSKTKDTTRDSVATGFKAQAAEIRQMDTEIENMTLDKMSDSDKARYMRHKNPGTTYANDAAAAAAFNGMLDDEQREGLNFRIAELQARRKKMNDVMETAQDFAWVDKLAKGDEKAMKAANSMLGQSYLWKQNASQSFEYMTKVWDQDAAGHWGLHDRRVTTTVGEFVKDFMGTEALEGRLNETQMAAALAAKDKVFLTRDDGGVKHIVEVTKNAAGGYDYIDREDGHENGTRGHWTEAQYTEQARTGQAVENVSASNIISNAFRRSHVRLSNYINQTKQRQRQASGGGGGGRK